MTGSQAYKWFFEATTAVEAHLHAIIRTIASTRTKFQYAEILETASFGKALVLDGRIQSSLLDDFIYHEGLVHPGMLAGATPARAALVIGGGEGATVREILKYPAVERAVMCDIDGEVVDLCRRHLPEMHQGALDDQRTDVLIEDARAWLERTSERFDFICIDLVEPLEEGPACLLFTKEFYTLVRERLTPGGAMTMQAGMTRVGELEFHTALYRTLRQVFPTVAAYQTFVPCFATPWGFLLATTTATDPRRLTAAAVDRLIAERVRAPLAYWDGETHVHAFSLPKFLRQALEAQTRVITDAHPLLVK